MPRSEASEPDAPRGRKPGRRRLLLSLLGGAIALGLFAWYVLIPYPWTLGTRNPERTSLMEQRIGEARADGVPYEIRQEWLPLEEISPALVRAVIVAEDYRFREHRGVDWVSLAEEVRWAGDDDFSWLSADDLGALAGAVDYAWSSRDELRGRSTITQQLAKNLYFGTERTFVRKGLELVVAGRLERRLGKDRILELYLNTAEWGPGIFGAEAAARAYFGRSASSLTLEQAATLAATLPHPLTSNPERSPRRMLWRRALLLDRLDPNRGLPPTPMPVPPPELADVGNGLLGSPLVDSLPGPTFGDSLVGRSPIEGQPEPSLGDSLPADVPAGPDEVRPVSQPMPSPASGPTSSPPPSH